MTAVFDMDVTFPVEFRHGTVVDPGQGRLREDEIQLCQDLKICCDWLDIRNKFGTQGSQDHLDLFLLF